MRGLLGNGTMLQNIMRGLCAPGFLLCATLCATLCAGRIYYARYYARLNLTVTTDGCGMGWLSRPMMCAGEGGVVGQA